MPTTRSSCADEAGALIARGRLKHQYPHSWRSKKPVIFRNTPQWFIAMDKPRPSASRGEGESDAPPVALDAIERTDSCRQRARTASAP